MKKGKEEYSKLTKEMLAYGGTVHCVTRTVLNDDRMNLIYDSIIDSCCTIWAYEFCQQNGGLLRTYKGSEAEWKAEVKAFTLEKIQRFLARWTAE